MFGFFKFLLFCLFVSGRCCLDRSSIHQSIFCSSSQSPDTCPVQSCTSFSQHLFALPLFVVKQIKKKNRVLYVLLCELFNEIKILFFHTCTRGIYRQKKNVVQTAQRYKQANNSSTLTLLMVLPLPCRRMRRKSLGGSWSMEMYSAPLARECSCQSSWETDYRCSL